MVAANALLFFLACVASVFSYFMFFEDDSAVWVNTKPPVVEVDSIAPGSQTVTTLWNGYYRRDCDSVQWHRVLTRKSDSAVVWKNSAAATHNVKSDQYKNWIFEMPLPTWIPEGEYRYCFIEQASCHGLKTWTNDQGCVEFEIVGN